MAATAAFVCPPSISPEDKKKGNPEHVSLFNDVSVSVVIRAIKQAPGRRREREGERGAERDKC